MQTPNSHQRTLQDRAVFGFLLMTGGLFLYALSDAFLKHFMSTYSVSQAMYLRSISRLLPLLIAMYWQGGIRKVLGTQYPGRHIVRLGVNLAYTSCFILAMSMGTLTMTYTLGYTSPFFMVILSALFLHEKISKARWVAVSIGMVGVLVAMRPGTGVFEFAALLVLVGALLGSLNKILMRRLAETEHSLAIAIYPNVAMILCTLPLLLTTWQSMPWSHWGIFCFVGCITALGQYTIAQALRFTQASILAPIDYSTFFWVVAFDILWWQKWPDSYSLIGAAIIVGSNLYMLYCTKREQSKKVVTS